MSRSHRDQKNRRRKLTDERGIAEHNKRSNRRKRKEWDRSKYNDQTMGTRLSQS